MTRAEAAASGDDTRRLVRRHHGRHVRRTRHGRRQQTGRVADKAAGVVRFAASKVAAVVGLHEFADAAEDFLELLYQDRKELLAADARALRLPLVTEDEELEALMAQTGDALAPQLREILRWTAERRAPARLEATRALLADVDTLLAAAQQQRVLDAQGAGEAKRLLRQKIHRSVGVRNENLALRAYEQQHGCVVRLTNAHWYWLRFPPPPRDAGGGESDVFAALDAQMQRRVVSTDSRSAETKDAEEAEEEEEEGEEERCFFAICGMVDGVADVLAIAADDEWTLTPAVVEVKNRVRAFRDPPPLYDHVQMAVYMKMLGLAQGELVQCLHADRTRIKVSRISLHEFPLGPQLRRRGGGAEDARSVDLWTGVVLPRLYQYTTLLHRVRDDERLRLAFLNGTPTERLEMLRRECDFL